MEKKKVFETVGYGLTTIVGVIIYMFGLSKVIDLIIEKYL